MSTPSFDSFSPVTQVVILIIATITGILSYFFGARSPALNGNGNGLNGVKTIVSLENERLRNDLELVLTRHREAIDNRILQQADGLKMVLDAALERLRFLELAVARLETARDEARRRE